ncbi:MAG: L-rhamnose mutarotase [Paracoccaceae bacterium]
MQRYGMIVGVNAEKKAEYVRLHAAVWPDVLRMITECGSRSFRSKPGSQRT